MTIFDMIAQCKLKWLERPNRLDDCRILKLPLFGRRVVRRPKKNGVSLPAWHRNRPLILNEDDQVETVF